MNTFSSLSASARTIHFVDKLKLPKSFWVRTAIELEAEVTRLERQLADLRNDEVVELLLSPRQKEVLTLLACGFTTLDTAKRLSISPATVHGHYMAIFRALDVHTQVQAALWAWRNGIVSIDEAWQELESSRVID